MDVPFHNLHLQWILHQGNGVARIPGTTKTKNLDDNIGLLKVKLNNEDLKEISDLVPINEVAGDRIHAPLVRFTYKFANTT
ncbi:Aldo/keto reductase/potassium channel subunit beta [Trema orientale]|uniref:Aldo/keto reductase/potassium channel subunit beta n=1 Tax=Trema orientale TaxID=63057 RepID=A0A2P5ENR4_TREOI|nr:Aldo/keto reductase/potassium channel subunit beta [Trema orientale]